MTPPRVLLVEIGTPAELPPVTPPAPRPPSSWTPNPRPSPGLAPPTGLAVEVMADAAKLTWTRSAQPGAVTVVEGAPDVDGTPGPWLEMTTTADDNYTIALPAGPFWVRLYALLNGRQSVRTNAVLATPRDLGKVEEDAAEALRKAIAAEQAAAQERIDRARDVAGVAGAVVYDPEEETPAGTVVRTETGLYRALQLVPVETPPPNGTYWKPLGTVAGLADGQAGNASAISDLQATSEDLGYQQALMAGALTDVQAELPGKASTQSVSLLQGEVSNLGGRVEANSQAITQVNAQAGGGGNLLPNAGFGLGTQGMGLFWNHADAPHFVTVPTNAAPQPRLLIQVSGTPSNPGANIWYSIGRITGVEAGRIYAARVRYGGTRPGSVMFQFRGAEDQVLDEVYGNTTTGWTGAVLSAGAYGTSTAAPTAAPNGTQSIVVVVLMRADANGDFGVFLRPQVEEMRPEQTAFSPWSEGAAGLGATVQQQASVLQSFTANAGPGGAYAQAMTLVDANGRIAAQRLTSNGQVTSYSVLADTAEFISADGSFRITGGRTEIRSNGYMRVEGKPFGQSGDLLSWYGPEQTSLSNCTKANGLFWLDDKGDGYFAGRVLQGVLRFFNSTESTSNTASISTGSNSRLGKQVSLEVRYQFSELWTYTGSNPSVTPGAGQTRATIVLERRYGSGSWTTLATRQMTGDSDASNPIAGSGDPATWSVDIAGRIFLTDTVTTTNDTEYRARITFRGTQNHSGAGTSNPVVRNQYLSIEALE